MNEVTEFFPGSEACTATIYMTNDLGEAFLGPLHIGCYPGADEVWIKQDGLQIQIEGKYLDAVIKQLRRARKFAAEQAEGKS